MQLPPWACDTYRLLRILWPIRVEPTQRGLDRIESKEKTGKGWELSEDTEFLSEKCFPWFLYLPGPHYLIPSTWPTSPPCPATQALSCPVSCVRFPGALSELKLYLPRCCSSVPPTSCTERWAPCRAVYLTPTVCSPVPRAVLLLGQYFWVSERVAAHSQPGTVVWLDVLRDRNQILAPTRLDLSFSFHPPLLQPTLRKCFLCYQFLSWQFSYSLPGP